VDQADEQTSGANKRTLLTGEHAMIAPEPGKNDQAKPAPTSNMRRSVPRANRNIAAVANTSKVSTPAPPRPSVEVIEGAKKKTVDFP